MKIKSLQFVNHQEKWQIEKISFDQLNLLVGASGVGKTRILRTLDLICDVAQGRKRQLDNVEWRIEFSHLSQEYRWEIKTASSMEESFSTEIGQTEIIDERLIKVEEHQEIDIIYRSVSDSKLNNQKLPKLKRTESAINLLSEEDLVNPVWQGFKQFIFNEIKETYIQIFPIVQDIRVSINLQNYRLLLEIQEQGSEDWIPQQQISSGMFRILIFLVDILSVPGESIIVIDEFENSLGINCMPEITDFIQEKSPNIQFILTSHHPYIINNMPWNTWQIVTRCGHQVTVRKATDIPGLKTASSLDKFTQLVNLLEWEECPA